MQEAEKRALADAKSGTVTVDGKECTLEAAMLIFEEKTVCSQPVLHQQFARNSDAFDFVCVCVMADYAECLEVHAQRHRAFLRGGSHAQRYLRACVLRSSTGSSRRQGSDRCGAILSRARNHICIDFGDHNETFIVAA